MTIQARPYQIDAIVAYNQAVIEGRRRSLIVLPTGCGKTVMGLLAAKQRKARTLWIAHRDELLTQPQKTARIIWPEAKTGIVKAERNEAQGRDIVFASIQTICGERRLARLMATGPFDFVVADEAHHTTAPSWRATLEKLGCLSDDGPPLLGLTATPERGDGAGLNEVFDGIAYQYHLDQALKAGFLSPPTFAAYPINVDLSKISTSYGDYTQSKLAIELTNAEISKQVVEAYRTYGVRRRAIAFMLSVEQARVASELFKVAGIRADYVSGETPEIQRRAMLKKFAAGGLDVLVNCMVLTEGFDDPGVDCIIMARPTKSKSLYIQCVGRGLRKHPGKTNCLIVDMVGASGAHTMVQAPVIFAAPSDEKETGKDRETEAGETDPLKVIEYWESRLSAQVEGLARSRRTELRWLKSGKGVYALPCGSTTIVLTENGADFDIEEIDSQRGTRTKLASEPIDLQLANGIAEDYIRRTGGRSLATGQGAWREGRPSDKQLSLLRRMKVDNPEQLTRGVASDLITAMMASSKGNDRATEKQLAYLDRLGIDYNPQITKRAAGRLISESRG